MFYISEVFTTKPQTFHSELQQQVYTVLKQLNIPYERVETDIAISMADCAEINEKLNMDMVKTLFLCNKKKTLFYLLVLTGSKKFEARVFSEKIGVSRLSFAPEALFEDMLGTKVGAATVFSALRDLDQTIQIVIDREVIENPWYGCSDGTNTGYMKIKTADVLERLLPYAKHSYRIIEM